MISYPLLTWDNVAALTQFMQNVEQFAANYNATVQNAEIRIGNLEAKVEALIQALGEQARKKNKRKRRKKKS